MELASLTTQKLLLLIPPVIPTWYLQPHIQAHLQLKLPTCPTPLSRRAGRHVLALTEFSGIISVAEATGLSVWICMFSMLGMFFGLLGQPRHGSALKDFHGE